MKENEAHYLDVSLERVLQFYAERVFRKRFVIIETYIDTTKKKVIYTGYIKKEE